MKLKDYILKHPKEMSKIGVTSGFFYMGRLNKLDEEYTKQIDEEFKEASNKRLKANEKQMKNVRKLLKEHFESEKMHDDSTLRNLCDQYVAASDGAVNEKVYQAKYVPIIEREVTDTRKAVTNEGKYIWTLIELEGDETYRYYLYNEWLADHEERK